MHYFLRVLCCFLFVPKINLLTGMELPQGAVSATGQPVLEEDWTRQMSFSGGTITLSAELIAGTGSPTAASTSKWLTPPISNVTTVSVRPVEPQRTEDAPTADSPNGWIGISTKHVGGGGVAITSLTTGRRTGGTGWPENRGHHTAKSVT